MFPAGGWGPVLPIPLSAKLSAECLVHSRSEKPVHPVHPGETAVTCPFKEPVLCKNCRCFSEHTQSAQLATVRRYLLNFYWIRIAHFTFNLANKFFSKGGEVRASLQVIMSRLTFLLASKQCNILRNTEQPKVFPPLLYLLGPDSVQIYLFLFIYFNLVKPATPYWLNPFILVYINKLAFTRQISF